MTKNKYAETENELGPGRLDPRVDPFLADLVHSVEAFAAAGSEQGSTVQMPVTLIVGGAVVSGEMTAGREWWQGYEKRLRSLSGGAGETRDVDNQFTEFAGDAVHSNWQPMYATEEATPLMKIGYVHLMDTHVVHPGGSVPNAREGTLMRIQLSEVQGWSLGTYEPSAPFRQ